MSIKAFFGKGLASLLNEHHKQSNTLIGASQAQVATDMERMFGNCAPAVVAFKIENGFVVRTLDMRCEMEGHIKGGFHYCKDHQEIAEHIITSETKRKLGIRDEEYLKEHLAAERSRAVAMQGGFAQAKRATNRI